MNDLLGREITYLRLSVTDRCNLRCFYCMPPMGVDELPHRDVLGFEEITRAVGILCRHISINKIRLTGGEPLIRKNITGLIKQLGNIEGIEELVLTTNGILLQRYAEDLREAGISRVNISLDTLNPIKFQKLCRGGDFNLVLRGIDAAVKMGLAPLKINVVLLKSINEEEVPDFIRFAAQRNIEVRFIELMKIGHAASCWEKYFISAASIAKKTEKDFDLEPLPAQRTTVKLYRIKGTEARVGFISGASGDLCEQCNRLRLTSEGILRPCLMSDASLDLRSLLRSGASDMEIYEKIIELVSEKGKPACYHNSASMHKIGG